LKTLLIDLEKGDNSIRSRIESGVVIHAKVSDLEGVESEFWKLHRGEYPEVGRVVLDSISELASITVGNLAIDPQEVFGSSIWAQRSKYVADKREWGIMSTMVLRIARYFRELTIPSIFICAEDLRAVPAEPALNPALIGSVYAMSDCLWRLFRLQTETKLPDGQVCPADGRVLGLDETGGYLAGSRFPDNVKPIKWLINPTISMIEKAFGGALPKKITLYGKPKIGKTQLSCS